MLFFAQKMIGLLVVFLCPVIVYAQVDTSLALPTVEVKVERMVAAPAGTYNVRFDSAYLASRHSTDITELLRRNTGWFVKNYGGGSLATTSVRGGSASHTAVVWNGIPLENPMLGQVDISLLPLTVADQLTVQHGGRTSTWGSGAIGGSIMLNNRRPKQNRHSIRLESSAGSFGRWEHQLTGNFSVNDCSFQTKVFHRQAINDFEYTIREDLPERRQKHASTAQSGLFQSMYWTIDGEDQLQAHVWRQTADREIPPKTTQDFSEAEQSDELLRTMVHYRHQSGRSLLNIRAAWMDESNDYRDPRAGINAHNRFKRLIINADYQRSVGTEHVFRLGGQGSWTRAISDAYQSPKERIRPALYMSWRMQHKSWTVQAEGRAEWMDGDFQAIVPALGLEYRWSDFIHFRARINRNFRMPTLNDLHWFPGGNSELQPEQGWGQELGFDLDFGDLIHYSATGFNRHVNQWILWAPTDGQFYWSAQNLSKVHSRGLEQRLELNFTHRQHHLKLEGGYDYIKSTNEVSLQTPSIDRGDQLIYVPEHRMFSGIKWNWKGFACSYNHRFSGSVFTENERLDSYDIGAMYTEYTHEFKQWQVSAFFEIENIWDASYQIVERRPMPGRHYRLGIQLFIHTSKNDQ